MIIAAGLLVGLAMAHPAVAGTESEQTQNGQAAAADRATGKSEHN
jgi:hypothetical protein